MGHNDGELKNTSFPLYDLSENDSDLLIGSGMTNGLPFDGMIDDVIILNEALTPEEIKAVYDYGYFFCDLESALVSGNYLSEMPQDPKEGNNENSGYMIKISPAGGISVKAPYTSQYADEIIEVSF